MTIADYKVKFLEHAISHLLFVCLPLFILLTQCTTSDVKHGKTLSRATFGLSALHLFVLLQESDFNLEELASKHRSWEISVKHLVPGVQTPSTGPKLTTFRSLALRAITTSAALSLLEFFVICAYTIH